MSLKPVVLLIVDHPLRDLGGSVLIASELAKLGVKVILSPMAFQQEAVFTLNPDLVLINYIRKNNADFIHKMHKVGIKISLLDTEGGFYGDLSKYTKILCQENGLLDKIHHIYSWGHKMQEYWLQTIQRPQSQVVLTGASRFDLYHPDFLHKIKFNMQEKFYDTQKNIILFNTKVALANPQFQSVQQEKELYLKLGFSQQEIENLHQLGLAFIENFTSLVQKTALDFTTENLVLRPHPHERIQTYQQRLSELQNVSVNRTQDLLSWLPVTKAIVHRHCTTAIEGALAGIPSIAPQWVPTSSNLPDGEALSYQPKNYEEYKELIVSLGRSELALPKQAKSVLDQTIHDWLYQFDGQSHKRIAQAVASSVQSKLPINNDLCFQYKKEIHQNRKGLIGKFISSAQQMPASSQLLLKMKYAKWRRSVKSFNLEQVQIFTDPTANIKLKTDDAYIIFEQ